MLHQHNSGHETDVSARVREARKKPGGSNVGKFPGVKVFAGPAGGAPAGSFPVNSMARAKSAIKLSHNAPNPAKLRAFVFKRFPTLLEDSKFGKNGQPKNA